MNTLHKRVESHMHIAARVLTPRLREHAAKRGVPADLVGQLAVTWGGDDFHTGVTDPHMQQAYDDHEWGSFEHSPAAFARTFAPQLEDAFKTTLDGALRAHLNGDR